MSVGGQYNYSLGAAVPFRGQQLNPALVVTKPIDKVENIVNNTVDTFIPESKDEKTKKSHKTAIRVGSTVLVLSALVALLNPKFSSKLIEKMKTASAKYGSKAQEDTLKGRLNKGTEKFLSRSAKILRFANNYNPFKDDLFKRLCYKTSFTTKIHNYLTTAFDKIAKQTVYKGYRDLQGIKKPYDKLMQRYISKLPKEEQAKAQKILDNIKAQDEYFSGSNIAARLKKHEEVMSNLGAENRKKMNEYGRGFWDYRFGFRDRKAMANHVKDNMSFWAEDIIMPQRNKIESEGQTFVESLVGDGKTKVGKYQELLEIILPHVKKEERVLLEDGLSTITKKLNSAKTTECIKYFDKKRDLMLGSAPTDILTAVIGLAASGIAIGKADSNEDRLSRVITVALPAVAGLGVSIGMAAMLYSGIKGLLIGFGSSILLSRVGSAADEAFIQKKSNKEVKYA